MKRLFTDEAQPPSHLWTQTGIELQVQNGSGGHKWFGCILGVGKAGRTTLDLTHQLEDVPPPSLLIKKTSVTAT